jgi:Ca2+-dependent lipid-binding protein
MIGKSDPYVTLYVRPMFKVKTKVIGNNLNPEWNETFELIVEDKETQSVILEVILCCFTPSVFEDGLN